MMYLNYRKIQIILLNYVKRSYMIGLMVKIAIATYKSSLGLNIRSNDYQMKHGQKRRGYSVTPV